MRSENVFVSGLLQIVKAAALSAVFCLGGALIFALVLKTASPPDSVIRPVNQFIKAFGILFGCFLSVRGEKGWLKGLAAGLLTVMLTYVLFAVLGGRFSLSWLIFAELVFGAAAGVLSGIVAVNVRG